MNGLLGLNVRTLGTSRDAIMSAAKQIGGAFLLIQDDPSLVPMAKAAGFTTIYRQSGDETLSLDPATFVQTRAEKGADYTYLLNEQDPTPEVLAWTEKALDYADQHGIKLCLFNFATDRSAAQWSAARALAARAIAKGHAICPHVYLRGVSGNNASFQWLNLKHELGGLWLVTEYAFYVDAYHGWRGTRLAPAQYAAFLNATLTLFQAEQMPVLLFSGDNWPANAQGQASGFGVLDNSEMLSHLADLNHTFTFTGVKPVTTPTTPAIVVPASPGVAVPATVVASGVRLRANADLSAPILRTLDTGEAVTLYSAARPTVSGYPFAFLHDKNNAPGWAAIAALDGTTWIRTNMPAQSWEVALDVPYVSQIDSSSAASNNDCGLASLLMLERYWFEQHNLSTPVIPSVDDLEKRTVLAQPNPPLGLTFAQLQQVALLTGFQTQYVQPMTVDAICAALDAGKPVAVLLDYSVYNPASKPLAHILVVSGYNGSSVMTQDPYLRGRNVVVSKATLDAAMKSSPGNSLGYQGMTLA